MSILPIMWRTVFSSVKTMSPFHILKGKLQRKMSEQLPNSFQASYFSVQWRLPRLIALPKEKSLWSCANFALVLSRGSCLSS
ncbi:hypothetical protein GOP47_0017736 [Adiantum capillus-veneris]|uniref:Uncharacterized protein n=1 Tax=Adiantum capillus-veneris TaxID=13818 RepID=A0A9D4Z9G7_ADICA|nr:hypothetical protein GOP47_0017736 [Adiantum capillus-veneris]